jgi:hypothetical protein
MIISETGVANVNPLKSLNLIDSHNIAKEDTRGTVFSNRGASTYDGEEKRRETRRKQGKKKFFGQDFFPKTMTDTLYYLDDSQRVDLRICNSLTLI